MPRPITTPRSKKWDGPIVGPTFFTSSLQARKSEDSRKSDVNQVSNKPRTGPTRGKGPGKNTSHGLHVHTMFTHTTHVDTDGFFASARKPHAHTHTSRTEKGERCPRSSINRRHRPASQPHSVSHPHARARSPVEPSPARAPPRPLRQRLRPHLPPLPLHLAPAARAPGPAQRTSSSW